MNKKLNLSPVLLSILGISFLYLSTFGGVLFLTALLVFEVEDEVKINVVQYAIIDVIFAILTAVFSKASGIFTSIVKFFTDDYETINKVSKFDIFKHANTILGYVSLAVIIVFLITIAKKGVCKVPTLYQAVAKEMNANK